MPYRIKGTLKLPSGQPAAGVDIEFISRRNYSPLLMDLSSIIKTTSTGAYDITLEYGEYAVVVYWGCNQPSHIGKLFVFSDTAIGLDLQTLLQQADWQPATPEYIQQIQDWLASANSLNNQAIQSAAAAKASEIAAEADRAEVASNKTIVVNAQSDVSAKAADVTTKAAQVAANTATVNQKTPLAVAAADTASQKAVDAAASDASARDAATRAENAALAMTGAILDGGQCDLSSGFYPQPLTVNGKKYSTVWYVKVGGTVGGISYDAGDVLRYTTAGGSYFKIDAVDTATSQINAHASKVGAHQISGVNGLQSELDGKLNASTAASMYVTKTTTVNNKPLSGNIIISAADIPGVVGAMASGSIIERGVNANGEYTKFADGTMICVRGGILASSFINQWGNLLAKASVQLPNSFVNTNFSVSWMGAGRNLGGNEVLHRLIPAYVCTSYSQVELRLFLPASGNETVAAPTIGSDDEVAPVLAIGRWK